MPKGKAGPLERGVEREILHALNLEGCLALKYKPDAPFVPGVGYIKAAKFTPKGVSDIIVFDQIAGLLFSCLMEVKREDGEQRLEQRGFESRIKRMGGHYYIVRSKDEALAARKDFRQKVLTGLILAAKSVAEPNTAREE